MAKKKKKKVKVTGRKVDKKRLAEERENKRLRVFF